MGTEGLGASQFLTALAPSERYDQQREHRHKTLTDWGRQLQSQVRRWLPQRELFVVADSSFAALEQKRSCESDDAPSPYDYKIALLLQHCTNTAKPRKDGQMGRPRAHWSTIAQSEYHPNLPKTQWQTVTVLGWYGGRELFVEVMTGTAVWYHTGMPVVPMRWLLVREERGQVQFSSSPVYQSGDYSCLNSRVVCATLADRSNV